MSGKRTFSEIKTRATLRTVVPASHGSSVSSLVDEILVHRDDFFLFPGTDQTIVRFRLERTPSGSCDFIFIDQAGAEKKRVPLKNFDNLSATTLPTLKMFLALISRWRSVQSLPQARLPRY
jgi:hypothetical protein